MFLFSVILVFSVIFLVVPRARSNVMTQILFQTYFHNIFSYFFLTYHKIQFLKIFFQFVTLFL